MIDDFRNNRPSFDSILKNIDIEMVSFRGRTLPFDDISYDTINELIVFLTKQSVPYLIIGDWIGIQTIEKPVDILTDHDGENIIIAVKARQCNTRCVIPFTEDEMSKIAAELAYETNYEILQELKKASIDNDTIFTDHNSLLYGIKKKISDIRTKLNKTENDGQFWCVVDNKTYDILKTSPSYKKYFDNDKDYIRLVGMIDNVKIYINPYDETYDDTVLLGYKGNNEEESGFMYSFYKPVVFSCIIENHATFMNRFNFTPYNNSTDYIATLKLGVS